MHERSCAHPEVDHRPQVKPPDIVGIGYNHHHSRIEPRDARSRLVCLALHFRLLALS